MIRNRPAAIKTKLGFRQKYDVPWNHQPYFCTRAEPLGRTKFKAPSTLQARLLDARADQWPSGSVRTHILRTKSRCHEMSRCEIIVRMARGAGTAVGALLACCHCVCPEPFSRHQSIRA